MKSEGMEIDSIGAKVKKGIVNGILTNRVSSLPWIALICRKAN